jgi:hypothetical protein
LDDKLVLELLPGAADGSSSVREDELAVSLDRAGSDEVKLALGDLDDGFLGAVAKDKFTDWWYRLVSSQQRWGRGSGGTGRRNRANKAAGGLTVSEHEHGDDC